MDKKYKSTVEIHAEHLQRLKDHHNHHHHFQHHQNHNAMPSRCRSLSSNSTASLVTVSSRHNHNHQPEQQQPFKQKNNLNRHQSAVYIKHVPIAAQPHNPAAHSIQNDLENNLEKSQKEIEYLRTLLTERNELIEKQKKEHDLKQKELVKLNDAKLNDIKSNDQLLKQLEEQKQVILNLKSKLIKLNNQGNLDSDTMSSISNSLDKVRQNVKKNLKKYDERVDASVQVNAVADTAPIAAAVTLSIQQQQQQQQKPTVEVITEASSLVCNIPEHHKLEDLLHENREYITKLKAQLKSNTQLNHFDEMTLLEKKAEFEALDLAINTRKQQLYNLELTKNRKLGHVQHQDDSTYSSNNSTTSSCNQTIKARINNFFFIYFIIRQLNNINF